ncbi:MAG: c-type cytochrome [Hyphomicrobiales bacterium]|nr:c-type cytochrome [Hyphomicrobiales bacterium]
MSRVFIVVLSLGLALVPAFAGPLHDAANNGDVEQVRQLIADGEDVNAIDQRGTPLHGAALNGHLEVAELLVAEGAKVDEAVGTIGWAPLHMAAFGGSEGVVALLIANAAQIDVRDSSENTPLNLAAQKGHGAVIKLLSAGGADVNAINKQLERPVHSAAVGRHFDVVELLYELGAAAPPIEPVSPLLNSASAQEGQSAFGRYCSACHTTEKGGRHLVGPNLWGVLGREKGSSDGFSYSGAFARLGGMWTYEDVNALIAIPKDFAPGTTMYVTGTEDVFRRANLIAYLRENSDNPPPLPAD